MARRGIRNGQTRRRPALGRLMACLAVALLALAVGVSPLGTGIGTGIAAAGEPDGGIVPIETGIGTAVAAADETNGGAPRHASREYLIKAAILYNFAKFTRWPAESFHSADSPLRLCVIGVDPFGEALKTIEGKRVGTRNLRTRWITDTAAIGDCHVLFVSSSEADRLSEVLAAATAGPVLTVAEMPEFARAGGIIALKVVDDRTRFDVNSQAADRAGLTLSAKLLRLAETVIQK